jgi:homoserine/homoserine lactone efflux protein
VDFHHQLLAGLTGAPIIPKIRSTSSRAPAMNGQLFAAFLLIAVLLFVTPGPVVTLVVATVARSGTRAGLATVAGTSSGFALLLAAIASGLSWVVSNASEVFELLRWVGAAYLIWLGIAAWRGAGSVASAAAAPGRRAFFGQGVLVGLTNPKTIAFFTAFLPQFIDPALPAGPQLWTMCAASVLLAAVTDSFWAIAAGLGRGWLVKRAQARLLGRLSGAALIGGGIWLTLARRTS